MEIVLRPFVRKTRLNKALINQLIFGLAVPLLVFGFFAGAKGIALVRLIEQRAYATFDGAQQLVYGTLSMTFLAIACYLFIMRRKAITHSTSWHETVTASAGTVAPLFLVVGEPLQLGTNMLIISGIVLFIGQVFTIWALVALGRCFGIVPAARGLVTHGPYKFIRHPLYVAEAIATLGLLLIHFNLATLIIYVIGMLFQVQRAHNEEHVLEQTFPEYAAYRNRTGRFLPMWRSR